VSDLFEEPDDATPLTPEEARELIPVHIAYRRSCRQVAGSSDPQRQRDYTCAPRWNPRSPMWRWSAFADEGVHVSIPRQQEIEKADALAFARFADAQKDQVLSQALHRARAPDDVP
jgi:hypothetical protein